MDIRSDRQKGLSYVELGRKYHMDPRTAKRYAESPQKPEYTLSEPKPTKTASSPTPEISTPCQRSMSAKMWQSWPSTVC